MELSAFNKVGCVLCSFESNLNYLQVQCMNSYLDNACKTIWFSLCMINYSICRVCNNCSNRILLIESLNVLFNLCFISFHLCLSDKPVNWLVWRSGQEMYRDLKISWFEKKYFFLLVSKNKIEFDFFHFFVVHFSAQSRVSAILWLVDPTRFFWSKVGDESKTHSTSHSPKLLIIITHYLLMFPWS